MNEQPSPLDKIRAFWDGTGPRPSPQELDELKCRAAGLGARVQLSPYLKTLLGLNEDDDHRD